MVKVKTCIHEFFGYLKNLNMFSFHILALLCELSCVMLILSLILNEFASTFKNPVYVMGISESCSNTGVGFMVGGIVIALIADMIVKYDFNNSD